MNDKEKLKKIEELFKSSYLRNSILYDNVMDVIHKKEKIVSEYGNWTTEYDKATSDIKVWYKGSLVDNVVNFDVEVNDFRNPLIITVKTWEPRPKRPNLKPNDNPKLRVYRNER